MLSLWNPFLPVRSEKDGRISHKTYFDRLFEDTFENAFNDLFYYPSTLGMEYKNNEDGSLSVAIDLPGVKETDLIVEVSENVVSISGERKAAKSSYSIKKSFTLPEAYDADKISAELADGILTLTVASKPLPATKERKQIEVTSKK